MGTSSRNAFNLRGGGRVKVFLHIPISHLGDVPFSDPSKRQRWPTPARHAKGTGRLHCCCPEVWQYDGLRVLLVSGGAMSFAQDPDSLWAGHGCTGMASLYVWLKDWLDCGVGFGVKCLLRQ